MRLPMTMAMLSELIGLIYDAAISPAGWGASIEAIRLTLAFHNASFALHALPTGALLVNVTSGIPERYLARIDEYGMDVLDMWGDPATLQLLPMSEPLVLSRINPAVVDMDTSTNRYVQEWARPQGLVDSMTLPLARDAGAVGVLAMGRHGDAGPIGELELEAGRLLIPHLQRAATINRLLDMATLARATFAAALDSLTVPVLLVGEGLRLHHANPAAEALLLPGGPLALRDGVLSARAAPVGSALAIAVEQAIRDEAAIGRKGLGIPLRHGDVPAGALHVLPLSPGRFQTGSGRMAAIFMARADTPFVPPTDMASALFDLTPAEARVFGQIATGRSVAQASAALGVERSTVRTHLLRLFDKTGARRQAELVQLAASLTVPVAG